MLFETARLKIGSFSDDKAAAFFELSRDDGFNRFPITIYRQDDLESAKKWVRDANAEVQKTGLGKYAVWEKATGALVGMGGLTPWNFESESLIDVTYRLREASWGMGYGSELALGLVDYGFRILNLPELTATITPDNEASQKVPARLGMNFDRQIILKGVETDLYRVLRKPARA